MKSAGGGQADKAVLFGCEGQGFEFFHCLSNSLHENHTLDASAFQKNNAHFNNNGNER